MTQEAGPSTVRDAIKAFKDAQEQRVNHWKEYDEALAVYRGQERRTNSSTVPTSTRPEEASGHYHTEPLPMTDEIFTKILALVTSGLLDSSHSVRAVETELRTRFHQVQLAKLVGQVQDLENAVLRKIVQRDQSQRTATVEGRDVSEESIRQEDASVQKCREEIQELMAEINAEVAELEE